MIADPLLLEAQYADVILAASRIKNNKMTEAQKRRIERAAKLHYDKCLDALLKVAQKEKV